LIDCTSAALTNENTPKLKRRYLYRRKRFCCHINSCRSLLCVNLSADVGATAYFPAGFTGSTAALAPAVESPTWGAPSAAPQYVPADLLAAAAASGSSVIVAGDSPSSQHHHHQQQHQQQAQHAATLHVLQPYPPPPPAAAQQVSVVPAAGPPTTPHQPQHHPATAGFLQQQLTVPSPAHLQVCSTSPRSSFFCKICSEYNLGSTQWQTQNAMNNLEQNSNVNNPHL